MAGLLVMTKTMSVMMERHSLMSCVVPVSVRSPAPAIVSGR